MAELKQATLSFRQHKLLLTKSYRKLHRYIVEQCIESLQGHRTHMIGLFRDIVIDCHRDELMTPLMNYFKNEEAEYMHYLQVLDSAVVNLGRSIPPVWEPFQGSITPIPISSLPEPIPVSEPEVTNVPQKEQSNCMDDDHHISSLEVIPVSSSCPEHIPVSESDVTNLPQKEQLKCMDDGHISSPEVFSVAPSSPEHIPASESEITKLSQKEQSKCMDDHEHILSPEAVPVPPVSPTCSEHIPESEVTNLLQKEQSMCMGYEHIPLSEEILDSSVSPSPPDTCSEPHISNYHHQQTVNVSQCSMELQADHIVMPLHDIPIGDSETLLKQVLPCPISAQSLATVQIMCLKYIVNDPPNIDTVNDSGMLVSQNLPGG